MSKLYYNDPFVAAYMAREFGVKSRIQGYGDKSCLEFKYSNDWSDIVELWICEEQADERGIHPDSYSVFEPMVGDLISWTIGHTKYDKEVIVKSVESNGRHDLDFFASLFEKPEYKYLGVKIIQRNNKPFFTPLEVKDDS